MKYFRFGIKAVFAIVVAFGFASVAFAGGNHPEGEGTDQTFPTGRFYRCFEKIGLTYSEAKNTHAWSGFGKYCISPFPPHRKDNNVKCEKSWNWSLDNKDDSAEETPESKANCVFRDACGKGSANCGYWESKANELYDHNRGGCRSNGGCNWWSGDCHVFLIQGSHVPVRTNFFCAFDYNKKDSREGSEFDMISKCVDKVEGKEVADRKLCDNDTLGTRYYYKPKCEETDTKEQCEQRLKDIMAKLPYKMRMCFQVADHNNIKSFYPNQGGQTVRYMEFTSPDVGGWNRTSPCAEQTYTMDGGNPPEGKPEEIPNLIVFDAKDNDRNDSLIHTKVSGGTGKDDDYFFKVKPKKTYKGGTNITCKITDGKGNNAEEPSPTAQKSIITKAIDMLTRNQNVFTYPQTAFKPKSSGEYKIKCYGYGKNENDVDCMDTSNYEPNAKGYSRCEYLDSGDVPFLVAPAYYRFGDVQVVLPSASKEVLSKNNDKIKYNDIGNKGKSHDNDKWRKKPVVKIGELLTIHLESVEAFIEAGKTDIIDTGIGKNTGEIGGTIEAVIKDENGNDTIITQSITDANTIPPTTSNANGACNAKIISLTTAGLTMGAGVGATGQILQFGADNALVGEATVDIYDTALHDKIKEQEGSKLCSGTGGTFPCPYPARLQVKFEYEVAPFNFKVEVFDNAGNPIKVLYFGQGTSPKVEVPQNITITALKDDGTTATTFSGGKNGSPKCAAQNMKLTGGESTGGTIKAYIEIIDKDGNGFTAKAEDFANGVAYTKDAIIKVQKNKDTVFTPAMKSEPVIIKNANDILPSQMEYAQFPSDATYYPKYTNIALGNNQEIAILRGRINSIDTDNVSGNKATTKVWYEFQCEYCSLAELSKITGHNYTNADKSPTQQGWWIDRTFGKNNGNVLARSVLKLESTDNNDNIKEPSTINDGLQEIGYTGLKQGTYKLNILHGNFTKNGNSVSEGDTALSMPYFLLYNSFWTGNNAIPLTSDIEWNTSSYIYIKDDVPEDKRNYGVDTGGAKNTRSGGRTGKY